MRKIKSPADMEKVRRRNNILLGLVMIVLLTISTLGYSLMSADSENENVVEEGGFKFVRGDGLWQLVVGGQGGFAFWNLPSEVENIEVNLSQGNYSIELGQYYGQPLYLVNPSEGAGEILRNIGGYVLRYQEACLYSGVGECEGNLPVKDCSSNLIIFEDGNKTRVYSEGSCVFVVGDSMRGADAFLYEILGVN